MIVEWYTFKYYLLYRLKLSASEFQTRLENLIHILKFLLLREYIV